MKSRLVVVLVMVVGYSCTLAGTEHSKPQTGEQNESTVFKNVDSLSRIVNFSRFRPQAVQYAFTDTFLQAVLFFDSLTLRNFKTAYYKVDYMTPNFNKNEFMFNWLDRSLKDELMSSDSSYHGHPDVFLSGNGKLWFLNGKILYKKVRNENEK